MRLPQRSYGREDSPTDTSRCGAQVHEAVRVAPLVVVPAEDLDQALLVVDALDDGHQRVERARGRRADDVRRDDGVIGVDQYALQGSLGRGREGRVDLFDGGRAHDRREVRDDADRHRDAQ